MKMSAPLSARRATSSIRISGLVMLCSSATAGIRGARENIWQSSIPAQMVTALPGSGRRSRWRGMAAVGALPCS
eukprot:5454423-Alexandrium_andersonii.AAC.1